MSLSPATLLVYKLIFVTFNVLAISKTRLRNIFPLLLHFCPSLTSSHVYFIYLFASATSPARRRLFFLRLFMHLPSFIHITFLTYFKPSPCHLPIIPVFNTSVPSFFPQFHPYLLPLPSLPHLIPTVLTTSTPFPLSAIQLFMFVYQYQ